VGFLLDERMIVPSAVMTDSSHDFTVDHRRDAGGAVNISHYPQAFNRFQNLLPEAVTERPRLRPSSSS
jgi:hypothetical protein